MADDPLIKTTIITGDARHALNVLPDGSFHCCVTSPPFWRLRDYGHADQIGQEHALKDYIEVLTSVFREVRRVLRDDGTLWLNIGDCFAAKGRGEVHGGLTPKDLIGVPWRVAFALQADGWILRSDIIWHKKNPIPESVSDRPTRCHEYIFMFSKKKRYFYDYKSIRELSVTGNSINNNAPEISIDRKETRNPTEMRHRSRISGGQSMQKNPDGMRNRRDVWTTPTHPFRDCHFAVFPPEIPDICIRAGSPPGGAVLDPFSGAGTTGVVARRLGRSVTLIDVKEEYCEMARDRIKKDCPHGRK